MISWVVLKVNEVGQALIYRNTYCISSRTRSSACRLPVIEQIACHLLFAKGQWSSHSDWLMLPTLKSTLTTGLSAFMSVGTRNE